MKKLPTKFRRIYKKNYVEYASKGSLFRKFISFFENWYHQQAGNIIPNAESILDVGAGSLYHVDFERGYKIYDIVEPKEYLLKYCSKNLKKINEKYRDLEEIPMNKKYDKILSIMVLENVIDLDNHLKIISNRLKKYGLLVVEIPAQNDLLYWLSWRLSTGLIFWFKYKLDYGVLMAYERVNSYEEIMQTLNKYFYIKDKKAFPIPLNNLRIYEHFVCRPKENI